MITPNRPRFFYDLYSGIVTAKKCTKNSMLFLLPIFFLSVLMVIINKWKRKYIKLKACILAHKKMRSTQTAFFGTILADRKVYRRFKPILKEHTSVKLTKPRKSKQFDSDIWKDESKESWQNCSIWNTMVKNTAFMMCYYGGIQKKILTTKKI